MFCYQQKTWDTLIPPFDWGAAQAPLMWGCRRNVLGWFGGGTCVNSPVSLGSSTWIWVWRALPWEGQRREMWPESAVTLWHPQDTGKVSLTWEVTWVSSGAWWLQSEVQTLLLPAGVDNCQGSQFQLLPSKVSDISCALPEGCFSGACSLLGLSGERMWHRNSSRNPSLRDGGGCLGSPRLGDLVQGLCFPVPQSSGPAQVF